MRKSVPNLQGRNFVSLKTCVQTRTVFWCLKWRHWKGILSLKASGRILPCHFKLLVTAGNPRHSLFCGFITPNSISIFMWLPFLCLCLNLPSFRRTSVIKLLLGELTFLAIVLPFAMLIFKCYLITLNSRRPDYLLWSFSDHWSLAPTLLSQVSSFCVNSIGFVFARSDLGCVKRFFSRCFTNNLLQTVVPWRSSRQEM